MKITIEVETDTDKDRILYYLKEWLKDNFQKEAKVEIEG